MIEVVKQIAILAGWVIVAIILFLLYLLLMPLFIKIGQKIYVYFHQNSTYKEEVEKNDPVKQIDLDKEDQ